MRRPCKCRVWYQRYSQMYLNLIQQGVTKGSALMALRECHRMINESHGYKRRFIASSAGDSLDRIEFDVHNPKNSLEKPIDVGTIFITERDNEISNCS